MTDEFDPTLELGLPPDRYIVCTCWGFLTRNNDMEDLCKKFIDNGERFYKVLDRYDRLVSYVLNREDATAGSYYKWCIPFLKAFGATDHLLHECSKENMELMPNASRTMRYISNMMPTYINTSVYEHAMMAVMEALDVPLCQVTDSKLCLDQCMMGRAESRQLREVSKEISALNVPDGFYELNVPTELEDDDINIIRTLDTIFPGKVADAGAMGLMESTDTVTSHKKAYRMLDIRRLTAIDLNSTMYVGSSSTDFQPMDLVRDAGGLSLAFNGEEFAVRGCNIAILSEDTTVVSLFASLFFDKGPQYAFELAKDWSRETLESFMFSDQSLVDAFLREHPGDLPEVYLVDDSNVDEVSKRSDEYRRKILG